MNTKTVKPSMSLRELEERFSTEESCKAYLAGLRWPDGVVCARCGNGKVYTLRTRPFHWVCKAAGCGEKNGYRFSVLTATIFENTNIPLRTWFKAIYLMTQSKKGISALQIHRMIDPVHGKVGSYRSAWYMCHRIRSAMQSENFKQLTGIVEVDETFIGGSDRNRHKGKKSKDLREAAGPQKPGEAIGYGKTEVIGAIARKGSVVAAVVGQLDARTKADFVREVVSKKVELVATDKDHSYNHEAVDHSKGEYVRGEVHTNNIESFWSLLKRGVMGQFHNVSKKYLPFYLAEFTFRHNERKNPDIFRTVLAGC